MNDALIAVIIVIATIIPVAGTIHYAYSSIVSSREISDKFNEFGDEVDEFIWNHMNDPELSLKTDLDPLVSADSYPLTITAVGESIPGSEAAMNVEMLFYEKNLATRNGSRRVLVKVYMVNKPTPEP